LQPPNADKVKRTDDENDDEEEEDEVYSEEEENLETEAVKRGKRRPGRRRWRGKGAKMMPRGRKRGVRSDRIYNFGSNDF